MTREPTCERAERVAAVPCPYCNHRPIERDFLDGRWSCGNCDEGGYLVFVRNDAPLYSAVPEPLDFG